MGSTDVERQIAATFGKIPGADADFRIDARGRRRRLCDGISSSTDATTWGREQRVNGPRGMRCSNYAKLQAEDGRWLCGTHAEDRKGRWVMCAQPVAWGEDGKPIATCGHRARWYVRDENAWFCSHHDPRRPRCSNEAMHPGPVEIAGVNSCGVPQDPETPKVYKRHNGKRICKPCYIEATTGRRFEREGPKREPRPPCSLCHGSRALEDDRGKPFPCICTPFGRQLVNGDVDFIVLTRIEGP